MMRLNSSVDVNWVRATIVGLSCWPVTAGDAPIAPAATWTFWAPMAAVTSPGTSWYFCIAAGSSQMRMA